MSNPKSEIRNPQFTVHFSYRPQALAAGLGSVTPAGECDAAIRRIIEVWNASVPVNRVRRVNQYRYIELRQALAEFTADEICAAIEHYSRTARSAWNRQHNACMRFDNFIQPERLLAKVEDAQEAADRRQASEDRKRSTVRQLQADTDNRLAEMRKIDAGRRRFAALPKAKQRELLDKARSQMIELTRVHESRITADSVLRWAVGTMLKQEAG